MARVRKHENYQAYLGDVCHFGLAIAKRDFWQIQNKFFKRICAFK
jgi:hypothetical protein